MPTDIEKIVGEMKSVGELLAPNSFPLVSDDDEDEISLLKSRELTLDGYDVVIHYGKSVHEDRAILETFQVLGQSSPFLPFKLVSKLARKFLGEDHVCYVDVFVNNKKIYCWTLMTDFDGKPLPSAQEVSGESAFEGFRFGLLDRSRVNFF